MNIMIKVRFRLIASLLAIAFLPTLSSHALELEFDFDPIYEHVSETNGSSFLAVRPFYSRVVDPEGERKHQDYLWPIYTRKTFKDEQYSRFLFFGHTANFGTDSDRHRNWIIPFWFSGVDKHGEGYAALFPIGGTIHEFLGRDKITFALWPIYAHSAVNEVETQTWFWPIYSRTKGGKVNRIRVFPFFGRSNLDDEVKKKFILWPIYTSVKYTNERNPGGGFILFPIYGHVDAALADNYWYLPPFFRFMKGSKQWLVHAPWPFIQLADGQMHKRIFWPIYGKKRLGTLTKQYFLWPIIWNNKTEYAYDTQHRHRVIPIFAHESTVVTKQHGEKQVGDVTSRHWKLWPLMSWERNGDDSRFRTLELWPLRNTPGIEKNWAPFWTLYRRTNIDDEKGLHLLWGLYRQTKSSEEFEWSLLKGLAGYKRAESGKRFRFCFIWFGGKEDAP